MSNLSTEEFDYSALLQQLAIPLEDLVQSYQQTQDSPSTENGETGLRAPGGRTGCYLRNDNVAELHADPAQVIVDGDNNTVIINAQSQLILGDLLNIEVSSLLVQGRELDALFLGLEAPKAKEDQIVYPILDFSKIYVHNTPDPTAPMIPLSQVLGFRSFVGEQNDLDSLFPDLSHYV